jgi:hypothetical protein
VGVGDGRPEPAVHDPSPLPIIAKRCIFPDMATMNISIPDALRSYVNEQVASGGYG